MTCPMHIIIMIHIGVEELPEVACNKLEGFEDLVETLSREEASEDSGLEQNKKYVKHTNDWKGMASEVSGLEQNKKHVKHINDWKGMLL